MASFFVIRGKDHGQHFGIRGTETTVGRESANDIKLNDTEVSRQHAAIRRTGENQFEICDLNSSNGTHVNSKRVTQQVLHSGDRVQLGRTLLIFTGGPDPHSTQSLDGVEIVNPCELPPTVATDVSSAALSHIRHSVDSPVAKAAMATLTMTDDSKQSIPGRGRAIESTSAGPSDPDELEIVYQVSQAIRRTGDLQELLTQVLDLIFQWIACDRGCIMMLDDVTGQLVPTYSRGRSGKVPTQRETKLAISRTILDYVMSRQEGVLTSNAQDDSRWASIESISDLGVYEAICVPMLGRYGPVGAVYVDTQVSPGKYAERKGEPCFTEQHLKLMIAIAGQAALAIEDTQFYHAMLQSERLATMGQTIANLSHHVKNILQGVSGGTYLLQDGLKREDIDVIRRGWKIIERNQERISNLVMDMLSFSKERKADLREGDVHQLLYEIVELMHTRAAELGVELVLRPQTEPLRGWFDPEAMHRAVLNVITNAIDAAATAYARRCENETPPDESAPLRAITQALQAAAVERSHVTPAHVPPARVEVWCEPQAALAQLSIVVQDNGDGIAEEDKGRIFSPFESSKGAQGTGLGLPVSQKVMREHGGEITIDSQPGAGSSFILQWPSRLQPTSDPADDQASAPTLGR